LCAFYLHEQLENMKQIKVFIHLICLPLFRRRTFEQKATDGKLYPQVRQYNIIKPNICLLS